MNDPASRVAVVLVNWNGWEDCIECLSSLFASEQQEPFDVWLVDNASSDGSIDRITEWAQGHSHFSFPLLPGVRHLAADERPSFSLHDWIAGAGGPIPAAGVARLNIVRNPSNSGFAGGNNVGIAAAGVVRYSFFWFLNTDTAVQTAALRHLRERVASDSKVGIAGSVLALHSSPPHMQTYGGTFSVSQLRAETLGWMAPVRDVPTDPESIARIEGSLAYIVGASMFVRREFILRVGPMCEDYFLYFEELDWAYRARGMFSLAFVPQSIVFHKVGASSSQRMGEFSLSLLYASRVRFVTRFLPDCSRRLRWRLLEEAVRHLLRGRWMASRVALRTWWGFERILAVKATDWASRKLGSA